MRGYFPVEPLHPLQIHNVTPAAVTLPVLGKLVGLYTRLLPDPGGFYLVCIVLEFFQLEGTVRRFARKKKKPLTKATQIASVKTNAEKRTQAQPDRLRARYREQCDQVPCGSPLVVGLHGHNFVSLFFLH